MGADEDEGALTQVERTVAGLERFMELAEKGTGARRCTV